MKKRQEQGFTLFEIILVVGVSATIVLGVFAVFNILTERAAFRQTAKYLFRVHTALEDYTNINFDVLLNSLPVTGGASEVSFDDIKGFDLLPDGFRETTTIGQDVVMLVHRNPDRPEQLEALTLTEGRLIDNQTLNSIARTGGTKFGLVAGYLDYVGNVTSLAGTWSVDLDDLSTVYNPTITSSAGYVAVYGLIGSSIDDTSPFLFREDIVGDVNDELNRMETNLIMDGQSIVSANVMTVDRLQTNGQSQILNISGAPEAVTVERSAFIRSGTDIIDVENDFIVRGDKIDRGSSDPDLFVTNTSSASALTVNNVSNIGGNVNMDFDNPTTILFNTINRLNFVNVFADGISVNGNLVVLPSVASADLPIINEFRARNVLSANSLVSVPSVTAAGLALSGTSMTIGDTLNYSGNLNIVNVLEVLGDAFINASGSAALIASEFEIDFLNDCELEGGGSCDN